jgi:CheY-like chemotaxis protein
MAISILLVDDEETDIIRFQRAARKAGLQRRIEVCKNAPDALAVLASAQARPQAGAPPYFLLSDLKMPLMMGTELVSRLRKQLGFTDTPAFILSSSDSAEDIGEAISSGANGYIVKCQSEKDYLDVVRWLDERCRRIDDGKPLAGGPGVRPSQVVAGPVPYLH